MFVQPIEMTEVETPAVEGEVPTPRTFRWQGRDFTVTAVLKRWQDQPSRARGALRPREVRFGAPARAGEGRTYFRVRTQDGAVFDLAFDPHVAHWALLRKLAPGAS